MNCPSSDKSYWINLTFGKLTESYAKEICEWKYESPYDIYNMPNWDIVKERNWGIANELKRNSEFYSAFINNELIGFFRLIKKETFVTIGIGLHPNFCGKGLGYKLLEFAFKESKIRYGDIPINLEVREFNQRAIKCYEQVGFIEIKRYSKCTPVGKDNFIVMEYKKK